MLKDWESLPEYMRTEAVRPYYEILKKKEKSMMLKRGFDIVVAVFLLILLLPVMAVIAVFIAKDSKGGVFFRQKRVTQYGRVFKIFKFRTMVIGADKIGTQVTTQNDNRITTIGSVLRKYRLDEIPQIFNIILGDMSFVGTRPESVYYVMRYTPEMFATLLLPAGITSEASIRYKDEAKLLEYAEDVDKAYIQEVLPEKMKYNLASIRKFSFWREIMIMIRTVITVIR